MAYQKEILKNENIISGNACYYIITTSELETLPNNQSCIPPLNAVVSAYYYPYLPNQLNQYGEGENVVFAFEECETLKTNEGITIEWFINTTIDETKVGYRMPRRVIKNFPDTITNRELNQQITAYTTKPDTVGGVWNYKNESKLQQYPYRYIELNDGLMNPILLEPVKFKEKGNNKVIVKQYLNPNGIYRIYVDGYDNDNDNILNGFQSEGIEVPISNNQYLNYKYENKLQNNLFYKTQMIQALNPSNTLSSISNMVNKITSEEDMKRLPNQLSSSSDYQYALQNCQYLYSIVHEINEQDLNRIGLFFHQYGYAQNKLMINPNLKSRKYYNYIKCSDTFLNSQEVPQSAKTQILNILSNGTTIWHTYNNPDIGNYSLDNPEI